MRLRVIGVTLAFAGLAGCGLFEPRVDTSNPDAYGRSIAAIEAKLSPTEKADFEQSLAALLIGDSANGSLGALAAGPAGAVAAAREKVGGKTAKQVIIAGLNAQISDNEKAAADDLAAIHTADAERQKHAGQLQAVKISDAKYAYAGAYVREPTIHMVVTNSGGAAVRRLYMHGVLTSPGRSIPWVSQDFNYEFKGGLEPNETRTLDLTPNMLDWEGSDFQDRRDLTMAISVLNIENADGVTLLKETDGLDDKAADAKAKQQAIADLKAKLASYTGAK